MAMGPIDACRWRSEKPASPSPTSTTSTRTAPRRRWVTRSNRTPCSPSSAMRRRLRRGRARARGPSPLRSRTLIPRRGLQSPNEALQPEPAPPPPPRRRRRQGLLAGLSGFLSFLLVACVAGGLALVAGYKRIQEPGPLSTDKVLFIAPGTDVPEIIAQLEREGVIDSPMMMNAA